MKPPVSLLQRSGAHQVAGPVHRLLDGAEHDRDVGAQADPVGRAVHVEPLLGVRPCRGTAMARTSSSRISAAVPGRLRRPGVHAGGAGSRPAARPRRRAPSVTSRAVKPWTWMSGATSFTAWATCDVVVAVEVGVDAALQAHLGGAPLDGLDHPALDVLEGEQVGRAPQVQRQRALGEAAEAALEGAHVRVVDVAVVDPGDVVAHHPAAQVVGDLGHRGHLRATGREQRDDLVDADLLAGQHPVEHLAAPRRRHRRRDGRRHEHGRVGARCPSTTPSNRADEARRRRAEGLATASMRSGHTAPGSSRPRPSASLRSITANAQARVEPALGLEHVARGRP